MAALNPRHRHGLPIGQGIGAHLERGPRRARERAFTLLELVAVVSIIAIFAALAIPSVVNQMRDRSVQEAARRIGLVYRQARMHALGRGSAVLVRFAGDSVSVREARLGSTATDASCADLPVSSCLTPTWSDDDSRKIDGFEKPTSGDLSTLALKVTNSANTTLPALDVCFTPMGRAFSRTTTTAVFTPIADAFIAVVSRPGVTRTRSVALLPNGTARLIAK